MAGLLSDLASTFARSFAYRQRIFERLRAGEKFADGTSPTSRDMNGAHIHVQDQGRAICDLIARLTGTPPWIEWTPPEIP